MRRIPVAVLAVFLALASCKKNSSVDCSTVTIAAPSSEVDELRTYITDNNIVATEDLRGFFYNIAAAGTGNKPTVCNMVTVNYTGRLTDGTVFETKSGLSFNLSELILGWQEGIPLIAPGGSITLYLPPSLGYGSSGSGTIPPGSILIFAIDLIAVN